jgi:DNA-binding NtrC family response regulator
MNTNRTVLVVDDDPSIIASLSALLVRMGFNVLSAPGPIQAIKLAEQPALAIDLLITDIYMPLMNGIELSDAIRALRPKIKVIYLSGNPEARRLIMATKNPAPFLLKPFTMLELEKTIRPAQAPSGKPMCPKCNSRDVRPSQYRLYDWVLLPVMAPHRCRECRTRFSRVRLVGKTIWSS